MLEASYEELEDTPIELEALTGNKNSRVNDGADRLVEEIPEDGAQSLENRKVCVL